MIMDSPSQGQGIKGCQVCKCSGDFSAPRHYYNTIGNVCFTDPAAGSPQLELRGGMRRSFYGGKGTGGPLPLDNLHQLGDNRKVMKVPMTAKLKLQTDAAQFKALRATQLAYRDGLTYVR